MRVLGVSTPGLTRAVSVSVGVPERDCAADKQPGWLDRHADITRPDVCDRKRRTGARPSFPFAVRAWIALANPYSRVRVPMQAPCVRCQGTDAWCAHTSPAMLTMTNHTRTNRIAHFAWT